MKTTLSQYANTSLDDRACILNSWFRWKGAEESQALYDLNNADDARLWADMYGIFFLPIYRAIGRYWVGGLNFYGLGMEDNKECFQCSETYCIDYDDNVFDNVLSEIEGDFDDYTARYSESLMEAIDYFDKCYEGRIRFKDYACASLSE